MVKLVQNFHVEFCNAFDFIAFIIYDKAADTKQNKILKCSRPKTLCDVNNKS